MIGLGVGLTALAVTQRRTSEHLVLGAAGPSANMSFARTTSAYRISSAGLLDLKQENVLRRDWGPAGAGPDGWLFEAATTNLLPRSAADTSFWGNNTATVSALSLGALGIFPGVSVASTGAEYGRLNSVATSVTSGQTYALTIWFKTGSSPNGRLTIRSDVTAAQSVFGGPIGNYASLGSALGPISQISERVFAGGERCLTIAFTPTETAPVRFGWGPMSSVVGQSTVLLAMQLETGSAPSSYVATAATVAARAADMPGIIGLSGTHDVMVTYADGTAQTFASVPLTDGYWPPLSQPRVVSVVVR